VTVTDATRIIETVMAMASSSMEKPFCLRDAIIPVDGGQLGLTPDRDSLNSTQVQITESKAQAACGRTASRHVRNCRLSSS